MTLRLSLRDCRITCHCEDAISGRSSDIASRILAQRNNFNSLLSPFHKRGQCGVIETHQIASALAESLAMTGQRILMTLQ